MNSSSPESKYKEAFEARSKSVDNVKLSPKILLMSVSFMKR